MTLLFSLESLLVAHQVEQDEHVGRLGPEVIRQTPREPTFRIGVEPRGEKEVCLLGSHVTTLRSNARPELLPEAGARHERTLKAVSSRPLLGRPGTDCRLYRPPQGHGQPQGVPFDSAPKS